MKRLLKEAAKKNDRDACLILAKEVLRARKAITKIYTSKAHLNSVQLQMKNQLGKIIYIHLCVTIEFNQEASHKAKFCNTIEECAASTAVVAKQRFTRCLLCISKMSVHNKFTLSTMYHSLFAASYFLYC